MKEFMNADFLLNNDASQKLFHEYAKDMPIFDYHCHLVPQEIAENFRYKNITQVWLGADHYKWRQIRTNGIDETKGDDWEKFLAWSDAVSHLIGNPLYHWTHLELQRYFGINTPLSPSTAASIYEETNKKLAEDPNLDVYGIFRKFNVYAVGTTDDPADNLEYHVKAKENGCPAKVMPSFRPDKAINIDAKGFSEYIEKLSVASGVKIQNASDVLQALSNRLDFFIQNGCLASDHSVAYPPYAVASEDKVNKIFRNAMKGKALTSLEAEQYKTYILLNLAKLYSKKSIVMQLHMQASRNNNTNGFTTLGPDAGYDAIDDNNIASKLSRFLDALDFQNALPKTVLYTLNPKDYFVMGSLMGAFQKDVPGKIQMGSGWWFCDNIDGMKQQMKTLGNLGMLSRFVGMLTDSRSFLSYPRHEYFRRILCSILGTWMENGEIPADFDLVGKMVQDISFNNAKNYFENK